MRTIHTEILINAPSKIVWDVLTDFQAYPDWNPFILSIEGKPEVGAKLKAVIQQPNSRPMTFKPVCLISEPNKKFSWLGRLGFKGLFDGEHIFEFEDIDENSTRFIQKENFNGILVPLLWKQLDRDTRKGFELMNEQLKNRAESFTVHQ